MHQQAYHFILQCAFTNLCTHHIKSNNYIFHVNSQVLKFILFQNGAIGLKFISSIGICLLIINYSVTPIYSLCFTVTAMVNNMITSFIGPRLLVVAFGMCVLSQHICLLLESQRIRFISRKVYISSPIMQLCIIHISIPTGKLHSETVRQSEIGVKESF